MAKISLAHDIAYHADDITAIKALDDCARIISSEYWRTPYAVIKAN